MTDEYTTKRAYCVLRPQHHKGEVKMGPKERTQADKERADQYAREERAAEQNRQSERERSSQEEQQRTLDDGKETDEYGMPTRTVDCRVPRPAMPGPREYTRLDRGVARASRDAP
jgi:hypothetical protein